MNIWAFVAKLLGLKTTGIWIQVEDIRGWCTRIFPGLNIVGPLKVAWDLGHHKNILLIDKALIPPITHKFWGRFKGCIKW